MVWKMKEGFTLQTPLTNDKVAEKPEELGHLSLLNLNEAYHPPREVVEESIVDVCNELHRYPDIKYNKLSRAVSDRTGVPVENQAWGAGASDLLYRAFNAVAKSNKKAVAPTPTFWGYERIYRLTGVDIERVELRSDCQTYAQDILNVVDDNTALVCLVTPANPTGLSMKKEDLIQLASELAPEILLLIDEVYFEFAEDSINAVELLKEFRNGHWAVLRSFSKAYALASARIGYALCSSEDVAHKLIESGLNFPVSKTSFSAAYAVYTAPNFLKNIVKTTCLSREWIVSQLKSLSLNPIASDTNFVSVELPISSKESLLYLKEAGVVCGQWNHARFANYIRITVGTQEENQKLVNSIRQLLLSVELETLQKEN
ncbi:histidinol-phosphate aminotransferase family protein [Marinomonas agarivorans]|nr:histidinol-phosphate aminotransferase family protein [Marinomonas agarivorans]